MDRNVSDNEILQSEIELLDSMFSSESCYMLDSVSSETNNSCITIVSRTPRFVFHIELKAKGKEDSSFESNGKEIYFRLAFDINPYDYPLEYPFVSVLVAKSFLDPEQKEKFQTALVEFSKKLAVGEPMLMDICNEAVVRINNYSTSTRKDSDTLQSNFDNCDSQDTFVNIIHLDHMRDKRNYIKTIEKWSKELEITGNIIFHGKLKVFLILLGSEDSLKSFHQQLKTQNVDIDSRGRPCKEKLSKILCCEKVLQNSKDYDCNEPKNKSKTKGSSLSVLEAQSIDDMRKCFCDLELEAQFDKYIA